MKKVGYMLIRVRKCINLDLFSEDLDELKWSMEKVMSPRMRAHAQIVPCFKDKGKTYLLIDGRYVEI